MIFFFDQIFSGKGLKKFAQNLKKNYLQFFFGYKLQRKKKFYKKNFFIKIWNYLRHADSFFLKFLFF